MRLFAIGDPHLSFATPGKEMDRFGDRWLRHGETIEQQWREVVGPDDLVAVPGDISWAVRMPGAQVDLNFLAELPGTKVLCRGNHDYWWSSLSKVRAALPDGMLAVGGDAIRIGSVVFGGTRLWDVPGVALGQLIDWQPGGRPPRLPSPEDLAQSEKIYRREVGRLRSTLLAMDKLVADGKREGNTPDLRVCLVHYPPVDATLAGNELTALFEAHHVHHVIFGHLHSVRRDLEEPPFGERNGVHYHLTSCDYLDFRPRLIAET